jgi:GxxExxY protein
MISDTISEVAAAGREVQRVLGPGYGNTVYKRALLTELAAKAIPAVRDQEAQVRYKGVMVGSFRSDMVVGRRVVVLVRTNPTDEDREHLSSYVNAQQEETWGLLISFGQRFDFEVFMNIVAEAKR